MKIKFTKKNKDKNYNSKKKTNTTTEIKKVYSPKIDREALEKKLLHTLSGSVIDELSNDKFKVELFPGVVISAYLGGKLRLHKIRIVIGDKVRVEMSLYDPLHGRIVERLPRENKRILEVMKLQELEKEEQKKAVEEKKNKKLQNTKNTKNIK